LSNHAVRIGIACVGSLAALAAFAQAPTTTPEITVTATRTERAADEVAASVSVRDRESLDERLVEDIRDLVRDEPGVTVRRAPARFVAVGPAQTGRPGNEGFNIRGIEGNRVLILIDGLRLPNAFSSFGRGDYADASLVSRVEILRGPASALYGSDGLAGAVSIVTPDPVDLLARSRADRHFGWRLAYDGSDEGWANTASAAARFGAFEALAMATVRRARELDNQGDNDAANVTRTRPNPQQFDTTALLAKLVWTAAPGNRVRLTVEGLRQRVDTDALSAAAVPPLAPASILAVTADDRLRRARASVDQRVERAGFAFADALRWAVYVQDTADRQRAFEDRNTAPDRIRDGRYEERSVGASLELDKRIGSPWPQRLTWGADVARTRYENLRDGTVPPPGQPFPYKDFPDTDYTLIGVFAQDDIALAGGRFALVPALRYDAFRLVPEASPLFAGAPVRLADSALSPKLALQWLPRDGANVYVYGARGFRAPTAEQVNNGFSNPVSNYLSIGNPDLKPETSRTLEVGAKLRGSRARATVALFEGRYADFIEQVRVRGSFTPADPAVFQYVNLRDVRIRGAEAGGEFSPLPAWTFSASLAWAEGEDRNSGQPLNSVNPLQVAAGMRWQAEPTLALRLDLRHAARKRASDADSSSFAPPATQFLPPSFTVVDLAVAWRPRRNVAVNAGVFNLTDRKYWHWTDVRGLAAGSPIADAFTQPGRYVAVNGRIDL
jgi:hemoglobin/transferrin/lactoferrin receptor protein